MSVKREVVLRERMPWDLFPLRLCELLIPCRSLTAFAHPGPQGWTGTAKLLLSGRGSQSTAGSSSFFQLLAQDTQGPRDPGSWQVTWLTVTQVQDRYTSTCVS